MGLDSLNKKVWHTGSMKNIQKVWEAEQAQHEIFKRQKERQKKLIEERHNEDLKRIQVEAGLIPASHLDRMDWMYDWGNKIQNQKTSQEYLTGKKTADGKPKYKQIFQEETTNSRCEDFVLLNQDPLYAIQKAEKERREKLLNNPIEMRKIIKEVEKPYLPQHDLKRKKQKHRNSKDKRKSSFSSSASSSLQRSRQKTRKSQDCSTSSNGGKRTYKQSSAYKQYLNSRFSGVLKKDQNGNLKPDYGKYKKQYKTEYEKSAGERYQRLEKMHKNAQKLDALKKRKQSSSQSQDDESKKDYEWGAAKIRNDLLANSKENRQFKKGRASDSD